jgi:hypothetical protein
MGVSCPFTMLFQICLMTKKLLFAALPAFLLSVSVLRAQVNFQSSNLPIVVINTMGQPIPDEPKIMANMGIIYNGPGQRNFVNNPFNAYAGAIGIELRGSTSQDLSDKKPYAVETRNADGSNLNVALLGMPSENDWVFLAPYSDKTLIRDVLTFTLARRIMPWAPRSRFVELVLNGNYQGVYGIVERIKQDNNRVNIATLNPDENSGDDLTGGYILKIDKWTGVGNDGFPSNYSPNGSPDREIFYQYHYPKPEDISDPQKNYIRQYINSFENIMASSNYAHPVTGYPAAIDVQSFIDFFLINEITRNVDGYRLSTFLHKNKDSNGGKLKMGPVWDFNIALGNANYCSGGDTHGWAADFNSVCGDDFWLIPFWWQRLREDPNFRAQIRTRWQQLRSSTFSNTAITGMIDSLTAVVNEGQARNFQRWPIMGQWIWPNNFVGQNYGSEVNYLKTWLNGRLIWMDGEIFSFPVATAEPSADITAHVFPSPATRGQTIFFECAAAGSSHAVLELFDLAGHRIATQHLDASSGGVQFRWQTDTPGMYTYHIKIDGRPAAGGKVVVY